MKESIERLHAATSGVYEFQSIVKGLRVPIYRVPISYILAKHPALFESKHLVEFKALLAEPEKLREILPGLTEQFLDEFLGVAIEIVEAGAPEFEGRIHIKRKLDQEGRPVPHHFTVTQLDVDFVGMLEAILRLSLPNVAAEMGA